MTATTHALVGAAIVSKLPNVWGFILAFLSHLPLDYIPHWDTITNGKKHSKPFLLFTTGIDVLLGFILVWYFFGQLLPPTLLFLTTVVAQLPDWLSAPYYFFSINLFPFPFIRQLQVKLHHKLNLPWGLFTQIAIIVATFFLCNVIPT